ncbi:hypothetical protein D3C71_2134040 [compost metagenome]
MVRFATAVLTRMCMKERWPCGGTSGFWPWAGGRLGGPSSRMGKPASKKWLVVVAKEYADALIGNRCEFRRSKT